MYVELENEFVEMKVFDDGSFIVRPKKENVKKDLKMLKRGFFTPDEFEEKYGIKELKKEAIEKYREILPHLEKAVEDFEIFVIFIENAI